MADYHEIFIELPGGRKNINLNINRIVLHASAEWVYDPEQSKFYHILEYHRYTQENAHAYIFPDGLYVKTHKHTDMAWHAADFNHNSLGIEFILGGFHSYVDFIEKIKMPWATEKQIETGLSVIKRWVERYDITEINTHHELSPDRKYDPGEGFPSDKFKKLL